MFIEILKNKTVEAKKNIIIIDEKPLQASK